MYLWDKNFYFLKNTSSQVQNHNCWNIKDLNFDIAESKNGFADPKK